MLPAITLLLFQAAAAGEPPEGMVLVPAGEFLMGSDAANHDEAPAHRVTLRAFYIDRHEVTNASFAEFVRATNGYAEVEGPWFRHYAAGCEDVIRDCEQRYGTRLEEFGVDERNADEVRLRDAARWRAASAALQQMSQGAGAAELAAQQARLPVRNVTWRDAAAFARWAGKRLPTEAEWEKAARGSDGRRYPWGPEWNAHRCRTGLEPDAGPAPVGSHAEGASPAGCLDMAGNVWEWVADWYGEDYYAQCTDAADPEGPAGLPDGRLPAVSPDRMLVPSPQQGRESDTRKVIRGGGWSGGLPGMAAYNVRCSRRLWSNPSLWHPDLGFRCAKDVK